MALHSLSQTLYCIVRHLLVNIHCNARRLHFTCHRVKLQSQNYSGPVYATGCDVRVSSKQFFFLIHSTFTEHYKPSRLLECSKFVILFFVLHCLGSEFIKIMSCCSLMLMCIWVWNHSRF